VFSKTRAVSLVYSTRSKLKVKKKETKTTNTDEHRKLNPKI